MDQKEFERLRDTFEERILFARNTRTVVTAVTTILAAAFTAIALHGADFKMLVQPSASDLLWRFSIIAYFWCWQIGCIWDTNRQELVYMELPGKGSWRPKSYFIILLLIIVAWALAKTEGNIPHFALALLGFLIVDHVGWRFLVKELDLPAKRTAKILNEQRDYISLEKLEAVRRQIGGRWKWYRLIAGSIIAISSVAFAFVEPLRNQAANYVRLLRPDASNGEAESFAFSLLVFLFIAVMEVWHFTIRFRTTFQLSTLDGLRRGYVLEKRGSRNVSQ
jgi:hypothetical protein